jgi:glycosyltransferase involved in cell wall biosynthesis
MHGARNVGGGEYSIFLLITNLRRDIFDIIVFYSHENEIIRKIKDEGIETIKIPIHKKITSVYRDEVKKNPLTLLVYAFYLSAGVFEVAKLLKKHEVDILHPHDNLSKIIGGIAAKITGVKTVAHCRDLLGRSLIDRFLLYYQFLLIDRIIAVSESNRKLFGTGRRSSAKVQTIYNGIDLDLLDYLSESPIREELNISDSVVVVGIIGVFDECKGHIYILQAIERIVSEGIKDIVCLVVGEGREWEKLKRFVRDKKLQGYVRFLGYRKDVPLLLKAMDFVAMPSIQESFPRVPLEAMAMKLPVIATSVGGLPELIDDGKTGILVPPADVDALCVALQFLIGSPKARKSMGNAGRRRVEERFRIENNIRMTAALYLDVLKCCEGNL